MNKYVNDFFTDTEGAEAIEFVAIVVVAAVLIGIIASIGSTMFSKGNAAATDISSALEEVGSK